MNKTIVPATFLAALVSLSATARADTVTVDVDLTEATGKASETTSFTMAVAEEGSCADASSESGSVDYRLELCRGRTEGGAPVLSFDVERIDHGKKSHGVRRLKVSSKLPAGTRTVVGRIARGDHATEIAATVR
jgi:hypothetical protein